MMVSVMLNVMWQGVGLIWEIVNNNVLEDVHPPILEMVNVISLALIKNVNLIEVIVDFFNK